MNAVAVRQFRRCEEGLLVVRPLKDDLPLAWCSAGYGHHKAGFVEDDLMNKAVVGVAQAQRVRQLAGLKVEQ